MIVKLLTEHYLEFLSLKGGCRGSSVSTLVKMSKLFEISCRGSHVQACYIRLCTVTPSQYESMNIDIHPHEIM